jgi:hypothetical protein
MASKEKALAKGAKAAQASARVSVLNILIFRMIGTKGKPKRIAAIFAAGELRVPHRRGVIVVLPHYAAKY